MTPSNANTSGLKNAGRVVWWKAGGVNYFPEGETFTVSESCRVEPLVTAASAQARIDAAEARADRLAKALERIERWFGEFPATGKFWHNADGSISDRPMPYGACWGSNGERDFMRSIARAALQQETQP